MPNQDDQKQPSIKEQKEAINKELADYDSKATIRNGHSQMGINSGTMSKEQADADTRSLQDGRQEILDRKKELGPDLKVGDKEAQYASKNFQEASQQQSKEELKKQYRESAKSQAENEYNYPSDDGNPKGKDNSKDKDDPEKG